MVLFAVCFYVARSWFRWLRSEVKLVEPIWRSGSAVFGFLASSISLMGIVSLILYGLLAHGFPPHEFIVLRSLLAAAVLGIVGALAGKGPLEIPAAICSIFSLVILSIHLFAS